MTNTDTTPTEGAMRAAVFIIDRFAAAKRAKAREMTTEAIVGAKSLAELIDRETKVAEKDAAIGEAIALLAVFARDDEAANATLAALKAATE